MVYNHLFMGNMSGSIKILQHFITSGIISFIFMYALNSLISLKLEKKMYALYTILCAIASVVIDLDHVIVLMRKGASITMHNLNTIAGRPLHAPLFLILVAWVILSTILYLINDNNKYKKMLCLSVGMVVSIAVHLIIDI